MLIILLSHLNSISNLKRLNIDRNKLIGLLFSQLSLLILYIFIQIVIIVYITIEILKTNF